ncbi:PaaI family thioesterase [Sphingopyxis indica]|uniref:PaaI family thioesterase n=1 Tax=Sphingopyxis indica TaxID=436663 RepID=UPI0029392A46|nr:PaaI family thioesterase [Sphingopyxis indica]WOF43074.1 PaaI family thioesterase [Sphingopyxis indica]
MVDRYNQSTLSLRLTIDEVSSFLDRAFPADTRSSYGVVESLSLNSLRMRLVPNRSMIRPGGIVSGPTLMALVDVAAYAIIAAHHGPEAMAVTNALSISFLRACQLDTVFADATILKLGRRLATVDVRIWQGTVDHMIALSTVGYTLP